MRVLTWLGLAAILTLIACSNGNSRGSNSPPDVPPTVPARGTVDGLPFFIVGSYAFWARSGPPYLWIELSSYYDDCRQQAFPPDKGTVIGIQIPRNLLAVGQYQATADSYLVNKAGLAISAGAYPYNDAGLPTSWSADLMGDGVVWLTSVSDVQVAGAFRVSALMLGINASGSFTAPICGTGVAGVDASPE